MAQTKNGRLTGLFGLNRMNYGCSLTNSCWQSSSVSTSLFLLKTNSLPSVNRIATQLEVLRSAQIVYSPHAVFSQFPVRSVILSDPSITLPASAKGSSRADSIRSYGTVMEYLLERIPISVSVKSTRTLFSVSKKDIAITSTNKPIPKNRCLCETSFQNFSQNFIVFAFLGRFPPNITSEGTYFSIISWQLYGHSARHTSQPNSSYPCCSPERGQRT